MKTFLALRAVIFAVLFLNFCVKADDSAHIVCSARDLGQTVIAKRLFTLNPVAPLSRAISTNLFSKEPKSLYTSADGVCTFSNVIWGYYRLDLAPNNSWNLLLGTNQSGLVSASVLITNTAALPPDPATNYYTMAQVDVIVGAIEMGSGFQHGSENLTNWSGITIDSKQDALNYTPATNSTAGIVSALGYTPQPTDADLTNWASIATSSKQDTLGFDPQVASANLTNWSSVATGDKQDTLGYTPQIASENLTNWSAITTASKQDVLGFTPQVASSILTNLSINNGGSLTNLNGGNIQAGTVASAALDSSISISNLTITGDITIDTNTIGPAWFSLQGITGTNGTLTVPGDTTMSTLIVTNFVVGIPSHPTNTASALDSGDFVLPLGRYIFLKTNASFNVAGFSGYYGTNIQAVSLTVTNLNGPTPITVTSAGSPISVIVTNQARLTWEIDPQAGTNFAGVNTQ